MKTQNSGSTQKKAQLKVVRKQAKAGAERAKKMSQLDAAAQILANAKEPMNAKALVDAMVERKLWSSPAGKTPHATLSAAIMREIKTKGPESRFVKAAPGAFSLKG